MKNTCLRPINIKGELFVQIFLTSKERNKGWLKNADDSRREQRHASARARRRQPLFVFGGAG